MAHILLIDDDAGLVDANKLVLESKGHEVSVAYTGDEAWKLLEKRLPDLLVMDVMMEEFTSGFTLAEDVHIKYPEMPVLMLTIRAFSDDQVEGYDSGADDYLTKPFANDEFQARIKVLERRILKK